MYFIQLPDKISNLTYLNLTSINGDVQDILNLIFALNIKPCCRVTLKNCHVTSNKSLTYLNQVNTLFIIGSTFTCEALVATVGYLKVKNLCLDSAIIRIIPNYIQNMSPSLQLNGLRMTNMRISTYGFLCLVRLFNVRYVLLDRFKFLNGENIIIDSPLLFLSMENMTISLRSLTVIIRCLQPQHIELSACPVTLTQEDVPSIETLVGLSQVNIFDQFQIYILYTLYKYFSNYTFILQ